MTSKQLSHDFYLEHVKGSQTYLERCLLPYTEELYHSLIPAHHCTKINFEGRARGGGGGGGGGGSYTTFLECNPIVYLTAVMLSERIHLRDMPKQ